jgi:glucokinase
MKVSIGIDLGGTSIKYALINENADFLFQGKEPSLADVSTDAVIGQLKKVIRISLDNASMQSIPIQGIGIGTPGIIDPEDRIVLGGAENIKGWENVCLADILEKEFKLPVLLGNDANLMGLAETLYGAAKGCSTVVFITVGTGIGGAVVIDGKLFNGYANRGTELGHTPLIANGKHCACGSVGCLETYASTAALLQQFKRESLTAGKRYPHLNGERLVELYKQKNEIAVHCMKDHFFFLGRGIAGFINIFSPQKVVVGGGLSEAGNFYIRSIKKQALKYALRDCAVNTDIVAAQLGNKAGSLGAAAMIFEHIK